MERTIVVAFALCGHMAVAPALLSAQADTGSFCRQLAAAFSVPHDTSAIWEVNSESHGCHDLTIRMLEAGAENGNWFSLASVADLLVGRNESDSAVAVVERQAARHPADTQVFEVLGALYITLKQYDRAHCAYVRGLAGDSTYVGYWAGLGQTAMRTGHTRKALGYWAHLTEMVPTYLTEREPDPGSALLQPLDMNNLDEEQRLYHEALAKSPRAAPATKLSAVLAELPMCRSRAGK